MLEGLPISMIALAINVLGLPGLIFIVWYVDQKRLDRIFAKYNEDMTRVIRMYEDNVTLVKGYERLANDLTGIITLTTRTLEGLVQRVDNNWFCPMIKKEGPKG
jgi:hypothetical protein